MWERKMTKARIFLSYIFLSLGQLAERTIKAADRNEYTGDLVAQETLPEDDEGVF
jgi:hypothetical protein